MNNPGAFAKWARVNTDPVVDAVSEELGITDSKRKQAIREIADGMDTPSAFHLAQLVGIGAFLRSRDLSDLQLEKVSELGAQAAGFISDIFGADVSQEDMRKMSDQEIVEGVIRASGRYRDVGDFVTPIQIARSFGYEPVVGPAGVYVEADPGDFGALAIPMMAGKDGTPAYVKVRMTPAARNKIRVAKKAAQGLGAEALISALTIANDLAPPEVSPIVPAFKPSQAKAPLIAPIVEGEAQ